MNQIDICGNQLNLNMFEVGSVVVEFVIDVINQTSSSAKVFQLLRSKSRVLVGVRQR